MDYNKLAELANFKTAASAAACFGPIKKKLLLATDVDIATATGAPAKGGTPKKSTKATANGDAEGDDSISPTKSGSKKRNADTATPDETEGGDLADTESTPVPKKARKATKTEDLSGADAPEADAEGGTPVKKKRVYSRKPKDPNAPPPTKRGKKAAAASVVKAEESANEEEDIAGANAQLGGSGFFAVNDQLDGMVDADADVYPDRSFDEEEQAEVDEGMKEMFGGKGAAEVLA